MIRTLFFAFGSIALNPEQRGQLQDLIKSHVSSWQIRKRLEAIRLLDKGYKVESVALQLCVRKATIYEYIKRFNAGGFQALMSAGKPGKESKMKDEYFVCLERFIDLQKKEKNSCTLKEMTEFLKESFGVEVGTEWLSIRLSYWRREQKEHFKQTK